MPTTREIDWTFDGTWPHPPRWFETPEGRLHYIDVGVGRPIVLLHGNPTWGYLYRHFIPPLVAAGHRVIVPDHLGFGRSAKPDAPSAYQIEAHAHRLDALLESLDLRDATVIAHDWGGPLGLAWAARHPERIHSLGLFNTFLHRPERTLSLPLPLRLFRVPGLGELLVKGLHAIVRVFLFRAGVRRPERLTATTKCAYLAAHPRWTTRAGVLGFARQFPAGPAGVVAELHAEVHRGLAALAHRPVFIAWAAHDAIFGAEYQARWRRDFPSAECVDIDAGHFLQEDAPEAVLPPLLDFLRRHP